MTLELNRRVLSPEGDDLGSVEQVLGDLTLPEYVGGDSRRAIFECKGVEYSAVESGAVADVFVTTEYGTDYHISRSLAPSAEIIATREGLMDEVLELELKNPMKESELQIGSIISSRLKKPSILKPELKDLDSGAVEKILAVLILDEMQT